MALNIKNRNVDRLARRVAELRETGITQAVEAALERDVRILEEEREVRIQKRIAESMKIVKRVSAAPVLDPRSTWEICDELAEDILDSHR